MYKQRLVGVYKQKEKKNGLLQITTTQFSRFRMKNKNRNRK